MEGMMKRIVLMDKGGPWEMEEVPIPRPGPGQFLCKVIRTSICNQTDLNTVKALHPPHDYQSRFLMPHHLRTWDNRLEGDVLAQYYDNPPIPNPPFPTTMGHEGMGVIVEEGPRFGEIIEGRMSSFHVGDRVGLIGCEGALGQYVLATGNDLVHVPENLTDEEASLCEPAMVPYTITRGCVHQGDKIVILGQGALGLMATQWCKILGAGMIITTDILPMKREYSLKCGADYTLDPHAVNIRAEIEKLTGGAMADVVIEAAGVAETTQAAPYLARFNGRIAQMGALCEPVLCDWGLIHFKGLNVFYTGHPLASVDLLHGLAKCDRAIELIALEKSKGHLNLTDMITHRLKLTKENVEATFKEIDEKGTVIKAVFDPWAE